MQASKHKKWLGHTPAIEYLEHVLDHLNDIPMPYGVRNRAYDSVLDAIKQVLAVA